jgi:dolichol-phosphate mannosyltransferase
MKISAILTVYSETDLLRESVKRLRAQLDPWDYEILLAVHPKSSAECLVLCGEFAKQGDIRVVMQGPRSGIGWAYREAIPFVTGNYALLLNSDLETDPDDAAKLVRKAEETAADIVCASRWLRGGGFTGYDPLKLVLNYGFNLIFRTLYRTSIHDLTFGYKLIRADLLRQIKWECGAHEFCAEVLLKPLRLGYTAVEIPTRWVKRSGGESKMTFMRNFEFLYTAWRILRQPKAAMISIDPLTDAAMRNVDFSFQ